MAEHAEIRDAMDETALGPPKPTVQQMWSGWVLQPGGGVFAAVYAVFPISWLHEWWAMLLAEVAALLAGLRARRSQSLRWAALGWILVFATLLVMFPVLVVVHQLR